MPFAIIAPMRPFTWILVAILVALIGIIVALCLFLSAPHYRGAVSDHFDGKRFENQQGSGVHRGFLDFLRWRFTHEAGAWQAPADLPPGPPPPERVGEGELRVTAVGHATFLIQMDGVNVLVDPVWSERASPVSWAGPRRHAPPGIRFEELPPIDAVLITHNHYDHLDLPTLRRLAKEHHPRIFAGLGNGAFLANEGVAGSRDLDWWEAAELVHGIEVHFVPAQHFSARGLCDRNNTLWGGFVIRGPAGVVYVAGDTGMGPHFAEIRERFGRPRLAILPIGAYLPRWFMSPYHLSPEDALAVHEELGAGTTVVSHSGIFKLGDDGQFQGIEDLAERLVAKPALARQVWIIAPGEGREVPPLAANAATP